MTKKKGRKEVKKADKATSQPDSLSIDKYSFFLNKIPVYVRIYQKKGEFVPTYETSIPSISEHTEIILEKIRQELIAEVNVGIGDTFNPRRIQEFETSFRDVIALLVEKYFPDATPKTREFLTTYLIQRSFGLGNLEILRNDDQLEEIAVNSPGEPVWVYHMKHGWLKSNLQLRDDDQAKHYASAIGRKVGRQITVLEPLMDANLASGDRVNATLAPVSLFGNTITLRKFAAKPWTITDFISQNVLSLDAAALIWLSVQYELSIIIAGGTASGKTSMLNVVSNFFPPNQRIISIEDTHELQMPKYLHWVPMVTRTPNPEGKGGISMLDLLVNSLRMRPDRILVGEIRRKAEAEVLFEAIHTGHSVYATVHANNAAETINRLTNPPISVPKTLLPAISMILVQYRNRRTGIRRTFQIAEIEPDATERVLLQYDSAADKLRKVGKSRSLIDVLKLYTGLSNARIDADMREKVKVLKWLVKQKINTVDTVGRVMAEYYTNRKHLLSVVNSNKQLG